MPDLDEVLSDEAPSIATEVTRRMTELHPDMFEAFRRNLRNPTKTAEEWCTEDTVHHLRHLHAALGTSPEEFWEYAQWLVGVLSARGIPVEDIRKNFAAMSVVLQERYGDDAAAAVEILEDWLMKHDSAK
jgi:hypothetical protein